MKRCEDCRHSGVFAGDARHRVHVPIITCHHPRRVFTSAEGERIDDVPGNCGPDAKNFEPKEATR